MARFVASYVVIRACVSSRLFEQLDDEDKKTILAAVKDTTDWIDSNGQSATADELEEKLSGMYVAFQTCCLTYASTEVQAIVSPITSKLYGEGSGPQSYGPGEDDEEFDAGRSHDEL